MSATVLVLRTCKQDRTSHGGFLWPESGPAEAPDWLPTAECGHGLHGWLWGVGDMALGDDPPCVWLVVEVDVALIVDLGGKVKYPRGTVIYCGDMAGATALLRERAPESIRGAMGDAIVAGYLGSATAGYLGSATAGYLGSATAGDLGSATAGYRGSAMAGDRGSATAGYLGSATAGDRGSAMAGYRGSATAGYLGSAMAGDRGSAMAGDRGSATAGYLGSATAGDLGSATAGYLGSATAGDRGSAMAAGDDAIASALTGGVVRGKRGSVLVLRWWDGQRYDVAVAIVGKGDIVADVWYRVVDGAIVRATDEYVAQLAAERAP